MDAKIKKAISLAKDGFNESLIEQILGDPGMESFIREDLKLNEQKAELDKLELALEASGSKPKNKNNLVYQIGLRRKICELRNLLAKP